MLDSQTTPTSQAEDELDLTKVFQLIMENWKLFAVFIPLGIGIAFGYLWYSHPVYNMTATVLVEDEGGSDISQSILDEVGVLGKKRNIENEIAILSSRFMMGRAILAEERGVDYAVDFGLKTRDLYEETPILVDYNLSEFAPQSFLVFVNLSQEDNSKLKAAFSYTDPKTKEDIEILRFFELNIRIKMTKLTSTSIAVDKIQDVKKAEKLLKKRYG